MNTQQICTGLLLSAFAVACSGPSEALDSVVGQSELVQSGVTGTLKIDSDWGSGYCASVSLRNDSTKAASSWQAVLARNGATIDSLWSGTAKASGADTIVTPTDHNAAIAPGASVSFGFCGSGLSRPTLKSMAIVGGSTGGSSSGASGSTSGGAAGSSGVTGSSGSSGTVATSGRSGSSGSVSTSGTSGAAGSSSSGGVVNATIVVKAGAVFDGGGKRYIAGPALGDGSQSESQKPVFRLENGAVLRNVVLGAPAADGIHTYGNATLENIVWEDIGEDALTVKGTGTVVINGGSAKNGDDKVFQINAPSTFRVSNFKASNAGKFIRQNGGTTFKIDVVIDRCDISDMKEAIFRTDSAVSTVTMTNTRYSDIGKSLFMGVKSANITTSNNTQY